MAASWSMMKIPFDRAENAMWGEETGKAALPWFTWMLQSLADTFGLLPHLIVRDTHKVLPGDRGLQFQFQDFLGHAKVKPAEL